MKKILSLFIIPLISLFIVTEVKAEEKYLEYDEKFYEVQEQISLLEPGVLDSGINSAIDYYKENYSNYFPYYSVTIFFDSSSDCIYDLYINIKLYNESSFLYKHDFFSESSGYFVYHSPSPKSAFIFGYDSSSNSFILDSSGLGAMALFPFYDFVSNTINPYVYYYSNFDYYYYGSSLEHFISAYDPYDYLTLNDTLYVPLYDNPTTYSIHKSTEDFLIEPYYLYDENSTLEPDGEVYTTIDLNNYSYVALSLKNYDVDAFDSTFYVKGQLCPTVVYNYGLEERPNTDRCNIAYNDFNPIRYRISDNDIKNHFIYYFKAYDTSIENKIKVDSSVFNIHYITKEEENNPILDINGYKYSSIPFDNLSSTANKNEAENFVPGASKEFSFADIFTAPVDFLKDIWVSISSVFDLIFDFISLLPIELQSLLYTAFALAIALGIIKILL